jgi:hypothetical protein
MKIPIRLRKRTFYIEGPMNLEAVWEEISNSSILKDNQIPYWTEIWPSSLVLGKFILTKPKIFHKKVCLDLGCGLGIVYIATPKRENTFDFFDLAISKGFRCMLIKKIKCI